MNLFFARRQVNIMTMMKQLCHILAPVSGRTMELSQVPDPVFAEKLTGDGLAIIAEGDTVLAPCDGVISLFFDTKHAFAITTDEGVQVLVHIGLDTVIMNGTGITAFHQPGERVKAGMPILKLDLPLLKKRQINLISPVLIVNYEKVASLQPEPAGKEVAAGNDAVLDYAV